MPQRPRLGKSRFAGGAQHHSWEWEEHGPEVTSSSCHAKITPVASPEAPGTSSWLCQRRGYRHSVKVCCNVSHDCFHQNCHWCGSDIAVAACLVWRSCASLDVFFIFLQDRHSPMIISCNDILAVWRLSLRLLIMPTSLMHVCCRLPHHLAWAHGLAYPRDWRKVAVDVTAHR